MCVRVTLWNTLINTIIAYTPNALTDAVELDASIVQHVFLNL